MTPEFLAAVIDTLLPGDEVLPSGTATGLDSATYVEDHREIFETIAGQAGGMTSFIDADEDARAAILRAVEVAVPDRFRALLAAALSDYCEASTVLTALGWRDQPPQPNGQIVPARDHQTARQLERIRRRGKLWRG